MLTILLKIKQLIEYISVEQWSMLIGLLLN
jgi:hypothetical protein